MSSQKCTKKICHEDGYENFFGRIQFLICLFGGNPMMNFVNVRNNGT